MTFKNIKIAGSLLFIGGVQYIFGVGAGVHYGNNTVVSSSVVLLGLLLIASAYFILKALKSMPLSILLIIAGIGALGVGFLPWGSTIYYVFAGIGYVSFGISAFLSYKFEKSPLSYMSIVLGALAFIALALWASGIDLGSGTKVTALSVDNLILPWLIGFGATIIADSDETPSNN